MYLPIDPQAFEHYERDVFAFQQQHHQCYMDSGAKIRALGKNDPGFSSLDPKNRQD